jgi:hypothetical protein
MGRVSAQNHVVHKRKTLLDFEIFSDLNPKKSAFSPLVLTGLKSMKDALGNVKDTIN